MYTLATLDQATSQEIFDLVVVHARTQKVKAVDPETESCKYRTKEGLKCFAGIFISDEEYKPEMEGHFFTSIYDGENNILIRKLQSVHDGTNPESWEERFRIIAENNNLNYTPPCEN